MRDEHVSYAPGVFGRDDAESGVHVVEWTGVALAQVIARRDRADAVHEGALRRYGARLPAPGKSTVGHAMTFLGTGPGQWLGLMPAGSDDIEARLAYDFANAASVFDQTDSRVLLELGGRRARDVLAKGCSLDLDPRVFAPGDVAGTSIAHLNVQLWHAAVEGSYRVLAVRTYFESFWRWLLASAAEYGLVVHSPRPYAGGLAATPSILRPD